MCDDIAAKVGFLLRLYTEGMNLIFQTSHN